jgi:hypothetical protein
MFNFPSCLAYYPETQLLQYGIPVLEEKLRYQLLMDSSERYADLNNSCLFPRKEVETITVGTNIRIRREIGKFTNLVDGGVLNSRAWVMQERILSPRNLHGTSAQLFWECGYGSHAEDGSPTRHADNIFHPQQKINTRGIELMAPDYKYDFYSPNDHSGKWLRTLYQWYALVEYYSGCNLTKQTDIFPAVSVPAQHFSGQIQSRYITGLWEDYLIHGLCWYLKDCSISTDSIPQPNLPYIAPSWPWASAK